jgi:nucleotide-binding universal stress UspA family protein
MVAAAVAQLSGGKLHLVTAYDPKMVRTEDLPGEFKYSSTIHPADALLDGLSQIVKQRGLETIVHAATGDPAEAIVQIAEQVGADLIVVGTKGMKGMRRVLGSVPNSVAHSAHCSVLIADTEASD